MLPSPSRLKNHDFSKPVRAQVPHSELPFIPAPSRLVRHHCPTFIDPGSVDSNQSSLFQSSSQQGHQQSKPLTTLMLSLPLAQKIHQLIVTSRQIESLARGLFEGQMSEAEVARYMQGLESRYETLREDVECELESAWVNAGFLPAATIPTFPNFPPASQFNFTQQKAGNTDVYIDANYTVDKALKRKREVEEEETSSNGSSSDERVSKKRKAGDVDEEDWSSWDPLQPIGIQQAMIPLPGPAKRKLKNWTFETGERKGQRKGRAKEEASGSGWCVSPCGTEFRWV
ncbi:hypothetical protein BDV95DRAFT_608246 [Massariosphaeria phaeospora]|uniref:Uncharacterized protein n=1 Tax=Massariosphaeria phaeospora TaxID=100035 RepID=A0A7C8MIH6_9PLEO|nr:hypothetical protein BDV95DRAFT_608246 [Massariosphaeria phaeospora]